jgi:coenzyme F420 hydrogenase subunit delta
MAQCEKAWFAPFKVEMRMIESLQAKKTWIFGCGNPFFGDDGFGPAVIAYLENNHPRDLGPRIAVLDVGTSIRDILFDLLLSNQHPERLIIIDAIDQPGRQPGELFEIDTDEIPVNKVSDFSLHQFPTTNMLYEIKKATRIDVRILVVQTSELPGHVRPGLTKPVRSAIPLMCARVLSVLAEGKHGNSNSKGNYHDHFSGRQTGTGSWCSPEYRHQLDP